MKPALPWFLKTTLGDFKTGCALLFTLPFLIGGIFCFGSLAGLPLLNWLDARDWEATDAVIEKAWLDESQDSDGDSYRVAVKFRYSYHGTTHAGTRHSFVSSSTNVGVSGMQKTVDGLPQGSRVTCWVNPGNPSEAVLDRSLPSQALTGVFFATPFLTVGLAGLGLLFEPRLRWRVCAARKAELQGLVDQGALPAWVMRPFDPGFQEGNNDVALVSAGDERWPLALAVTALSLFWNGIVGAFVCMDVISIASGEKGFGLLLSLFLIPFVMIGLGILWMAVKLWRLTRRPRWVAALRPVPDFGGGEVDFCWAWLDARKLPHLPGATVRIVAQAATWDEESGSATRVVGRKRRTKITSPAASTKGELELAAVEVAILDAAVEIPLTLPSAPMSSQELARKSKASFTIAWGGWWQLEVTFRDGEIELSKLTKAEKLLI